MNPGPTTHGSITIGGNEVEVSHCLFPQSSLKFYEDNPRIYSIIRKNTGSPSQAEIEARLSDMDHVKQLIQSIRANGGLIDPLIVRDGDYVVLEGNSRLAAYRALAKLDPIKWGMVKVTFLPSDVPERLVFALLGEYHIIGRKDWAPYEQAGYLFRRVTEHDVSPQRVAREMGLSVRSVNHLVEVFSFMVEHEEDDVNRWSYYEEYLKPRASKEARARHQELDRAVVEKIRSKEIESAVAVRDKVMKVIKGGDKSINILLSGPGTLERALISAADRGVDNPWLGRLQRFRSALAESNTISEFREMSPEHRDKAKFYVGKIEVLLKKLHRELD